MNSFLSNLSPTPETRNQQRLEEARKKHKEILEKLECAHAEKCKLWEVVSDLNDDNLNARTDISLLIKDLDTKRIEIEALISELKKKTPKNDFIGIDEIVSKRIDLTPIYQVGIIVVCVSLFLIYQEVRWKKEYRDLAKEYMREEAKQQPVRTRENEPEIDGDDYSVPRDYRIPAQREIPFDDDEGHPTYIRRN